MGLLSSFHVGVSGLRATGEGLSVIGDNIANAGTAGFKASRAEFQDVLAKSLKGIDGGDQIGAGTKIGHVTPVYMQGTIQRTENITDLAISGNGFFQVEAPFGRGYTRDGQFRFDKDGYLTTSDAYKITGFQVNEEGEINNSTGPIRLGSTTIPAEASTEIEMSMNLDTREKIQVFDITKAEKTSGFNSSFTVFDNIGTERLVTVYFTKVANNQWEYHSTVSGKDAAGEHKEGTIIEMASGKLMFNDKGVLDEEIENTNAFNFNQGAAPAQKIAFNFGKSIKEGGTGIDAATQYGSDSSISGYTQDGYAAATLTSMSFSDSGILTAVYNNGETRDIGQIAVVQFSNNEGLFKVGKNLMKETRKSGQAVLGKPGKDGRGDLLSKSVELSNVDIASEFVNLMTAQRNFSANAKTIATTDQMLQEVLQLKR